MEGGRLPCQGAGEKSLLAIDFGTPRIGPLGGQPNPLEVAVPVRIFNT